MKIETGLRPARLGVKHLLKRSTRVKRMVPMNKQQSIGREISMGEISGFRYRHFAPCNWELLINGQWYAYTDNPDEADELVAAGVEEFPSEPS